MAVVVTVLVDNNDISVPMATGVEVDQVPAHDSHVLMSVPATLNDRGAVPPAFYHRRAVTRAFDDSRASVAMSVHDRHVRVPAASDHDRLVATPPLLVDHDVIAMRVDVRVHIVVVAMTAVAVSINDDNIVVVSVVIVDNDNIVIVSSLADHLDSVAVAVVPTSPVSAMSIDDNHINIVVASPVQHLDDVSVSVSAVPTIVPIMANHHDIIPVPGVVPMRTRLDVEQGSLVVVRPIAQVEVDQVSGVVVPPRTALALPSPPLSLGIGVLR